MSTSVAHQLHLRHIPCKLLDDNLRDAMTDLGLDPSRFEIYLPKRPGRHGRMGNLGYAFVTCREQDDVEAFTRSFHGMQFDNIASSKRMVVEWAYEHQSTEPDPPRIAVHGEDEIILATSAGGTRAEMDEEARLLVAHAPDAAFVDDFGDRSICATSSDGQTTSVGERCRASPKEREIPSTRLAPFINAFAFQ
eukprot:TRINITY_DN18634_c0_g1_i1.p1 TRINITY_DN18634_c0_g1~~TRINITY_DN18634_c0_g1_i1.p1  ORF type:complete len:193 (-),score=25.37 TRINITY_DN18634_c0_g1_i1:246-824(-)